MAETRFIKTVTFGGYDKTDVDKRLEYLYAQVYELKNELRETKLTLKEYKKGTEEEKVHETILSGERAKLTQVQVQNETISDKLKSTEEDNKAKTKELEELREKLAKAESELAETSSKLAAFSAGGTAEALSTVFIEAQKSASALVATSKAEAEKLTNDARQAADDTITDANNKAKKIIYEAEKNAAVINAEAENKSEQMDVASNNMRAVMVSEVKEISECFASLKKFMNDFENSGMKALKHSEDILEKTDKKLKNGGVPVFREPGTIEPAMPDEPEYEELSSSIKAEEKKKMNDELEKLQAMAASIGGGKAPEGGADAAGGGDLDALLKQAQALGGGSAPAGDAAGGSDLDALLKQAQALGGGDAKKNDAAGGGMDLADLLKQAEALK